MSHARTQAGRARVLGASLLAVCVAVPGLPMPVAAAAVRRAAPRIAVPLQVVGEGEADGPVTGAQVSAQRSDEPGPAIEVTLAGETGSIELTPGVWSLIARAPGRVDRQQVFTLEPPTRGGPGPAPVRFTLALARVPVVLQLGPPEAIAAGATWTLVREGSEWGEALPGEHAREELSLQPGRWRGSVAAPGFVTQEFVWTVGAEPPEAGPVVWLRPVAPPPVVVPRARPSPRAPDPRLGLGLGLGLAGATSLGLGVGLLIQHRQGYAHFEAAPNNANFVAALSASSAGAALVGGGLGLGVAGLSAGLGNARDRVLWAELAVGGGVALIGAAWYAREWQDVQKDLYDSNNEDPEMDGTTTGHDPKSQRRETAAASFIGAGAGLILGAGVALLTRTVLRRRHSDRAARWGLTGGPGQLGLGLGGRF